MSRLPLDKRSPRYRSTLAVIVAASLLCTVCLVWMLHTARTTTRSSATEISRVYLQELTAQKIGLLQSLLTDQFTDLQVISEFVTADQPASDEELNSFLSRMQQYNGLSFLAFLDDQGDYHSADDVRAADSKFISLDPLLSEGSQVISYEEVLQGKSMILLGANVSPISFGDRTFVAILAGTDPDVLRTQLTLSASETTQAHIGLFDDTGHLLITCDHEDHPFTGTNLLSYLEQSVTFSKGYSLSQVTRDIHSGESGMAVYTADGQNTYLFYESVPDTDWFMATMVSSGVINHTVASLGRSLTRNSILVLAVFISLLLVIFLLSFSNMRRSAKVMAAAQKRAEEANLAKSRFLSQMSHDIRTPINGILGMTDIALRHMEDPARVTDCLQKIDGASQHLLSLINDVLDMSRIESGKTQLKCVAMDIRVTAEDCASIISGQLLHRDLELVREFDQPAHPLLLGDDLHLRQVLINILGNAVKFTPDGGRITFRMRELSADRETVRYRFEIEDTGVGMQPEFLEHIWDPFAQAENPQQDQYKGTGLGMSITKQLVELMGGTISVESQLQMGSKFTVELSFRQDTDAAARGEVPVPDLRLDGMRVLVAEDNALNAEITQCLLEDAGVQVTLAVNGQEALALFREAPANTFDAILMDMQMPVMDGLEATCAIRALDRPDAAGVPIFAMTANVYEEDLRRALDAGMNDRLTKPLDLRELFRLTAAFRPDPPVVA